MNVSDDWIKALPAFMTAAGAGWALWQYLRNSARDRARWLFDLFQRFYERPALRSTWELVDWGSTDFITEGRDRERLLALDEFLNFFELVAHLRRRRLLRKDEVKSMFDYPLKRIAGNAELVVYLRAYGYEQLDDLLRDLGYTR